MTNWRETLEKVIQKPRPMLSIGDCEVLYRAVLRLGAKSILELGTGFGHSTAALALAARETGGAIVTLDLWDAAIHGQGTYQVAVNNVTEADAGVAVEFLTVDDMTWEPHGEPYDMIFLDTSHQYDHTMAELNKYMPLLSAKGEMFLHDAIHEVGLDPNISINRAVLQFIRNDNQWDYQVFNTGQGVGRLQRNRK